MVEPENFYLSCTGSKNVVGGANTNETEYFSRFVSAIENQNIFGVQYHPEKSHEAGDIILSNYVNM